MAFPPTLREIDYGIVRCFPGLLRTAKKYHTCDRHVSSYSSVLASFNSTSSQVPIRMLRPYHSDQSGNRPEFGSPSTPAPIPKTQKTIEYEYESVKCVKQSRNATSNYYLL
jgi:hypothetical protein